MAKQAGRIVRQGQIYRITVGGTNHALFVWQQGKQFCGRVEGNTRIPEQSGASASAVCTALTKQISASTVE